MIKKSALLAAVALLTLVAVGCTPTFVPAPTGVPVTVIVTVVLTPTPLADTPAPPTAAPAVSPTPAAAATVGAAPAPTSTPAVATAAAPTQPAASAIATQAPAGPTATAGPSPTPCPIVASGRFGTAWTAGKLRQTFGCPLAFEKGVKTSFEPFERGFMFWRDDTRHVYAVYADGTWQEFPDTWVEGQAEYSCPDANIPSETPPTPRRGIGKVWCAQPGVRQRLGNALQDEIGNERILQDFQNGMMLLFPERGDKPVVLFKATGRLQQ